MDIFFLNNIYIICLQDCETTYFDSHYDAYAIRPLPTSSFLNVKKIPLHIPCFIHTKHYSQNETYIVMKLFVMQ